MAKFSFSVAILLACLVAVNASGFNTVDQQGNPCPPCLATKEYNPVCGSNGQTYANPSLLGCHSRCLNGEIKREHYGPCHTGNLMWNAKGILCSLCIIDASLRPVCGTNGKTYDNESALRCDALCKKSGIEVKHYGECN